VPVAFGGAWWFGLVALLASARPAPGPAGSGRLADYIFPASVVGLGVILYLGYASFFIIGTACLLCLGTYACVFGIFVLSGLQPSVAAGQLAGRVARDLGSPRRLSALVALTAVVALAGLWFPKAGSASTASAAPVGATEEQQFATAWAAQPRINFGPPPAGARAVLIKFNDWLCPSCKNMHAAYQPLLDKFAVELPAAVSYVLKDFPLNNRCNPGVPNTVGGHEVACEAAAAVRMARARQKEKEMVDWVFAEQSNLIQMGQARATDAIKAKVKALLGVSDFDREYATYLPAIRQDAADGVALEVHYTPTFFLNGVRTTAETGGNLSASYLELAIRLELKQAPAR
jgi:protein-disulfide isomerase